MEAWRAAAPGTDTWCKDNHAHHKEFQGCREEGLLPRLRTPGT